MSSPDDGLVVARRRRRIRAAVVLTLAVVLVVGGLIFAVENISTPSGTPAGRTSATCTPPALPQAASKLNVYNASGDSGSARTIAQKFAAGGFDLGTVSNDPYKETVSGSGQIRYGKGGEAFAKKYVLPLVPGAAMSPDGRTGSSVDVVLGKTFKADVPSAKASTSC